MVLGEEIEALGDTALGAVAERTAVFARVSPGQKNRIILALKHRGHVVGFLGDGINDAPSLHAADVGISVANAVDVAKDAADIILQERRLDVLHRGIVEGRKAFANVHQISADGHQLELRQHVQHGRGRSVLAVSAHAADPDLVEQLPL